MARCVTLSMILLCAAVCAGCAPALTQNADRIVIAKSAHTMTLMNNGVAIKTYKVAIGKGGMGPKQQRGDALTPEGEYVIDEKKDVTCCFLAMHLSYPNANDVAREQALGVDPGDMIEIHGLSKKRAWLGRFHRITDWTDGCVAVSNSEMMDIWPYVPLGTPVEIDP
jgi:murein L,D-transpeptidase YafK